jgi:hypothetical protein
VEHFASFGLNIYLGTHGTGKKSKTECLFCPAPPAAYTDPNTYDRADQSDIDMGNGKSIQVVSRYHSLGTIISGDSSCEPEIHRRITLGYASMAKMSKKVYGFQICTWPTQVATYETITLPIVLYGCKSWTVSQGSLDKLEAFNNTACRRINNINLWHMREYNITSASLLKRVGMQTMTSYFARLQLPWLGHVARMLPSRTPKQLLMAELMNCKRYLLLTYGRSITNMMKLARGNW